MGYLQQYLEYVRSNQTEKTFNGRLGAVLHLPTR